MPDPAVRIARLIQQLEGRVTDLEQGRPPDAPEREVVNILPERVGVDDSVSVEIIEDPIKQYNSGSEYNFCEYDA